MALQAVAAQLHPSSSGGSMTRAKDVRQQLAGWHLGFRSSVCPLLHPHYPSSTQVLFNLVIAILSYGFQATKERQESITAGVCPPDQNRCGSHPSSLPLLVASFAMCTTKGSAVHAVRARGARTEIPCVFR